MMAEEEKAKPGCDGVSGLIDATIMQGVAARYQVDDTFEELNDLHGKSGAVVPVNDAPEDEVAELPQFDLSIRDAPVKLKFKRQHTFQQRQRRAIKKHAKVLAATSHSVWQFLLILWRTWRAVHTHEFIAYALIIFGILSESLTPSPRYNVPIGTVLLSMSIDKIELKLLTTGLLLAIIMDIVWLCRHEEASYNATFSYNVSSLCRLWAACCLAMKAWLTISIYWFLDPHKMSTQYPTVATARRLRRLAFQKIGYFFPTTNLPPLADLSRHTLLRVVALLWIHVVAGLTLLALGLVSCVSYTMYPQFRSASLGIPLHYMILLKGGTTMSTVFLFLSHLKVSAWKCLKLLVSLGSFQGPLIHWHGVGYGQDHSWLKTLQFLKTIDVFCGCYLLLVLYSAFHHGSGFYEGVMAVLTLSTFLCVVLECWVPLLCLVVYKFVGVMEQVHREYDVYKLLPRNWTANDDDDDGGESSSDDQTSDGDSSSSSSSSGSSRSSKSSAAETPAEQPTWLRYYDTYNRPYIRNSVTGETFWDRPPEPVEAPPPLTPTSAANHAHFERVENSPLTNTIYMTAGDFKYFWNSLPYTGGFLCRIPAMPSVDHLSDHLSACRFYVITDGLAAEHIRAVYFYAIHSTTLAHFLGAFLMDSLTMQLEAKFKCDQPDMVPEIVQCLQLRYILGDYEPLEEITTE
ncbi:hypothetical protein Ae201684P_021931 [Aphanomyces euteiches]|uniref:WW domain-containing protein n=1 Tax=Aphanomyces euteiches TaxID=100861 RepID=A0A6G0WT03_9STRA|nr:hypothetical protein Ae201684_011982 [Aphanomyces euteiches]KAH9056194.1 hypothetical protein Ae201684P_021931 [Aphanomyces euteiches]KAH9144415.1 hypothetical protein AeRB84_011640 [Aphanomyces euteiches]